MGLKSRWSIRKTFAFYRAKTNVPDRLNTLSALRALSACLECVS